MKRDPVEDAARAWERELEALRTGIKPGPGRPRKADHDPAIVVATPAMDELASLRQQWRAILDGLTVADESKPAMCAALADAVGVIRLMSKAADKTGWKKKPGREGRKTRSHMIEAIGICGDLWARHTGQDWQTVAGWNDDASDRQRHLDAHPPIILARRLVTMATGRNETSWVRAFDNAKALRIKAWNNRVVS